MMEIGCKAKSMAKEEYPLRSRILWGHGKMEI